MFLKNWKIKIWSDQITMCYKKFWWKPDLVKSGYQKIMENAAEHQIFTILQMQVSFSKALKIYVFTWYLNLIIFSIEVSN